MNTYSQAGQDAFVYVMSGRRNDGLFLDVGASDDKAISNTAGLEEMGWTGLRVDIQGLPTSRLSARHVGDATTCDWARLWRDHLGGASTVDYLSIDVDESTTDALLRIMEQIGPKFGVITVETDKYRFGPAGQMRQRAILSVLGYDLVCSEVCIETGMGWGGQSGPFEDWWVHPTYAAKELRDRYRCHNKIGRLIVPDEDIHR